MPPRPRDERSTSLTNESASSRLSTASTASASSSTSASSAASTEVSMSAVDAEPSTTTLTTKEATVTGGSTGRSNAISAGIGAGTGVAVAGLILLLVAAVVFFRRRKQRHPDPTPPTPIAETSSNASPKSSPEQLDTTTEYAGLPTCCLLTGAPDDDVKGQLASLRLLIELHVKGNYHLDTILARPDTLYASLRQLQLSEGTRRIVVRLSIDPNTRYIAIRHLLALVIFSNLDAHSVGLLSLLPPTLKELSLSRSRASRESQDSLVETALVAWNRITAFLMHEDPEAGTRLPPPPGVESQVKGLVTLLQEFLVHFARMNDDGSPGVQQGSLERAITACVEFGYEIFSHPSDWRFTFPQQERGVVVVPGLEK